jgi:hypothetical protein
MKGSCRPAPGMPGHFGTFNQLKTHYGGISYSQEEHSKDLMVTNEKQLQARHR